LLTSIEVDKGVSGKSALERTGIVEALGALHFMFRVQTKQ
jgi:hypothetical protein